MASAAHAGSVRPAHVLAGRGSVLDRYFYLAMALASAALVAAGFGPTLDEKLISPALAPPRILWLHGAVFSCWMLFYILQSALVRMHNVKLHRTLGWAGAAIAVVMYPLGLVTAVQMVHFETYQLHMPGRYAFFAIPVFDINFFAVCIALAIAWRRKPEFHRRLIFFGTCALLVAAAARVDHAFLRVHSMQYLLIDLMIGCGILRDLLVERRVHTVYRVALPIYLVQQMFVIYLWRVGPEWWTRIARGIVG